MANLYCPDAIPNLFGFFDTTIAPAFLFYAYIPMIFISLFFGMYIFLKDHYSLQSKLLFALSISFVSWIINILFQWMAVSAQVVHFSAQITVFFETTIFIITIYFVSVFLNKKDIAFTLKLFLSAVLIVVLILLPTRINTASFDLGNCQGNVGTLWHYVYIAEVSSIIFILYLGLKTFFSYKMDERFKKQTLYFTIGVVLFLSIFSASNIFGEVLRV